MLFVLRQTNLDRAPDGPVELAMVWLGKIRYEAAMPHLIELLPYMPEGYSLEDDSIFWRTIWCFPAARALSEYGVAARPRLEKVVRSPDRSPLARKVALLALVAIQRQIDDLVNEDDFKVCRDNYVRRLRELMNLSEGRDRVTEPLYREAINFLEKLDCDCGDPHELETLYSVKTDPERDPFPRYYKLVEHQGKLK